MLDLDNIGMAKESKKFNLTKDSGRIRDMFEDVIDFFNRNLLSGM